MNVPRRRGRPAKNIVTATAGADIEAGEPVSISDGVAKPAKRRRRADVNGMQLKLAAPERKGYIRRWFNDTPGRLAEASELAYDHVCDASIKSDGTDSRVRRLVGNQANGQPLYAYLMETPLDEWNAGQAEREEQHRAVDLAISEGRDPEGRVSNSYGEGSIQAG